MPRPASVPKPQLHKVLAGLVEELPAPKTEWPAAKREAWIAAMRMAFDVVYGPVEESVVYGGRSGGEMARAAVQSRQIASHLDRLERQEQPMPNDSPLTTDISNGADQGPTLPRHAPPERATFVIDPQGYALRDGSPIDAAEIPPRTVIRDYRPQPVDEYSPIMWKSTGSGEQMLPAGVAIAPASEPYAGKPYSDGVTT